jgi:predicted DNA-binding protein (MmcQ/YjbR family)
MSVLTRRGFDRFVATLPAVTLHEQWGSSVAKVGGKVFALVGESGGGIAFKVSETAFEGLTTLAGISQAPYFAKGQWVHVGKGADISDKDLKAYLREAHRRIANKLTRKARAELGLNDLASPPR